MESCLIIRNPVLHASLVSCHSRSGSLYANVIGHRCTGVTAVVVAGFSGAVTTGLRHGLLPGATFEARSHYREVR